MGQQQDKLAAAQPVISDHTPIFGCFDDAALSPEVASAHRDKIASMFVRRAVPRGASIFNHKIGYRDLVIVERGELRMESRDSAGVASTIKVVGANEMLGMVELVENVEMDRDEKTGLMPADVTAVGKTYLLVLSRENYTTRLLANAASGDPACGLFSSNLTTLCKKN